MPILSLSADETDELAQQLVKERDEAVAARKKKGLDDIWYKARKQYEGVEVNIPQSGLAGMEKGETIDSPMTTIEASPSKTRHHHSSVFLNITRPYTNAGTALIADILLPTGKLPFGLKQTPVTDLEMVKGLLADYPALVPVLAKTAPQMAERLTTDAETGKAAVAAAEMIIKDWLKESNWPGDIREQIAEAGKVGSGVIKGPFPKERKLSPDLQNFLNSLPSAFEDPNVGLGLERQLSARLRYVPDSEIVKVENCFPDGECGSDIQSGRFFYERVPEVTRRQLQEYMDDSTYDSEAIQACLDEGPEVVGKPKKAAEKGPFELWLRTGSLCYKPDQGEKQELSFQITVLCNSKIIKSEKYWLPTETIPYRVLTWRPREGSWAGIGIPEEIETPQRGVNASVRALSDNMGFSVGPQLLEMAGIIEPEDGDWELYPYKRWKIKSAMPGTDAVDEAKKALTFLEFPNYLNEIMPVIEFWLKEAEDTTGLSLLLQGKAVTDAVGVSQQLMNNATTTLRQIIKAWDDDVCHPLITDYYEWVQLYGPPEAKGDAVVEPLGSTVLIVRELQQQALLQLGDKVIQPIYGLSPRRWAEMYLEGFQIDYEKLRITEEEEERLRAAEEKEDVKVTVAKIEAETDIRITEREKQFDELKLSVESMLKELSEEQKTRALEFDKLIELQKAAQEGREPAEGAESPARPTPVPASPSPLPQPVATGGPPPEEVDAALTSLGLPNG